MGDDRVKKKADMMPKSDDDMLAHVLGQVGALGGSGGRLGGVLGAKLLPTKAYERKVMVNAGVPEVVAAFTDAFGKGGQGHGAEPDADTVQMKYLMLSGYFNMNPAMLTAYIETAGTDRSSVTIVGKAKEGLINQHTAEKAVRRMVEALVARLRDGGIAASPDV
jgi:hypothetical protein